MVMSDSFVFYIGLSTLLKYAVSYQFSKRSTAKKEEDARSEAKCVGKVKEIIFFPVKSARSISITEATCYTAGMKIGALRDRGIAVMASNDYIVSALREPTVTRLVTKVKDDIVELQAPDLDEHLQIDLKKVEKARIIKTAKFFGPVPLEGYDCGDEAAAWISAFLDKSGYRMLYFGEGLKRRTRRDAKGSIANAFHITGKEKDELMETIQDTELTISNSSPISFISEASLDDVNERLTRPIDGVRRFRCNIVVDGVDSPYDEDQWDDIFLGDLHVQFVGLVGRCPIINTDPETGLVEKGSYTTMKCMKEWRNIASTERSAWVQLGINTKVMKEGSFKVGDPIYVTRRLVPQS